MVGQGRRRLLRLLAMAAFGGIAFAAAAGLGLRIYLGRAVEDRAGAGEIVDFHARGSAGRHNVFAMCPPGFCTPPADATSPVFAMRWERLRAYWGEVIAAQNDLVLAASDDSGRRFTCIQRSPVLRFPDIVNVEFIALGEGASTLAIDSRSRYGRGDFGVNRRRVEAWMALLRRMMRDGQERPS